MTTFGERLRKLRLERRISVSDLSNAIGFRRLAIYRWECGKSSPRSFDTVCLVANFFHVSPDYFCELPLSDYVTRNEIVELQKEISVLREEVRSLRQSIHKSNQ